MSGSAIEATEVGCTELRCYHVSRICLSEKEAIDKGIAHMKEENKKNTQAISDLEVRKF